MSQVAAIEKWLSNAHVMVVSHRMYQSAGAIDCPSGPNSTCEFSHSPCMPLRGAGLHISDATPLGALLASAYTCEPLTNQAASVSPPRISWLTRAPAK